MGRDWDGRTERRRSTEEERERWRMENGGHRERPDGNGNGASAKLLGIIMAVNLFLLGVIVTAVSYIFTRFQDRFDAHEVDYQRHVSEGKVLVERYGTAIETQEKRIALLEQTSGEIITELSDRIDGALRQLPKPTARLRRLGRTSSAEPFKGWSQVTVCAMGPIEGKDPRHLVPWTKTVPREEALALLRERAENYPGPCTEPQEGRKD